MLERRWLKSRHRWRKPKVTTAGRDASGDPVPVPLSLASPDPDVLNARGCVVADADTRKLVERLPDRAGVGLSGHASPAFAPHMLNLQEALADDWFAVALVELSGRVGNETLDGERAVLVLRVQDGQVRRVLEPPLLRPAENERAWS